MVSVNTRIPLLLLALVGFDQTPGHCRSIARLDPGFTDEFLVSLGTGAQSFLIQRLHEPVEERFLEGIVGQLCMYGSKGGKNAIVAAELRSFFERTIQRDEVLTSGRIWGAGKALECLGRIGSENDIDYLIAWALDASKVRSILCREERQSRDGLMDFFLMRALTGLGVSGHPKARDALLKARGDPPDVAFVAGYVGMTCQALEYHKAAREMKDSREERDLLRYPLPNYRFRRYPGVSETYLTSLGTGAVSYLISRLHSPYDGSDKDMYFRSGVIGRLVFSTAPPSKDRSVVTASISSFVEANSPRTEDAQFGQTIALTEALIAIGARGTDADIPFLIDWALGKRSPKRLKEGRRRLDSIEEAAVYGLGLLGSEKSLAALNHLRNAPDFAHKSVLSAAFASHAEVSKRGIDALLPE